MGRANKAGKTPKRLFDKYTIWKDNCVNIVDEKCRIIDVFPPHQQQQVRMQLSVNLVGVLSQTLVKTADRKGRVAAFETMEAIPAIRNLIREAKTHQIRSIIQTGSKRGMHTLDQHLAQLVVEGRADFQSALEKCVDERDFLEMVRAKKPELVEEYFAKGAKPKPPEPAEVEAEASEAAAS